jgi:peroxiredoxin
MQADTSVPSRRGAAQVKLESMGAFKQKEMLRAGQPAPDFTLERLRKGSGGSAGRAELLREAPVLLAFFKSSCPVCQMTLPFLDRVYRGRTPGSINIYGVSQDDPETTREFCAEFGITFPMLLDTEEGGYTASNAYNIAHVPSLFLLDRDGTIAWSLEGFNKREFVALAAQAGVTPFQPDENVPEWKAG